MKSNKLYLADLDLFVVAVIWCGRDSVQLYWIQQDVTGRGRDQNEQDTDR